MVNGNKADNGPCDIKKITECDTYISCQVNKQPIITFNNTTSLFEYDDDTSINDIDDITLFSFGNMKGATRFDNLAWTQIKNLIDEHNKKK